MRRTVAAGLAAAAVGATLTVVVLSGDNTVITAPSGKVTTTEGAWTFGATANGNGDYPLLLGGSSANGGWGASLRITNTQLYAFSKGGGHYWLRYKGSWVDIGAAAPIEGTYATKVTLVPASAKTPDNATAGTVIAKATVGMTPASATFVGTLVSTNPIYTFQGLNLVLSRGLTTADDGEQDTVVTALD